MFGLPDLSKIASPEMTAMLESLPAKVIEWSNFLARLDSALKQSDEKLNYLCDQSEDIAEKLTFIMVESAVTPELHDDVLAFARDDPRNAPPPPSLELVQ